MFKSLFPALLFPLLLIGAGCSKTSLSTNADSQLTITPVSIEESAPVDATVLVDGTYTLDTASSSIVWNAEKRVGAHHTGTVEAEQGAVVIENGEVTGGSMEVNMRSIADTDLTSEEDNKKLVGHLKSEDFFNVAVYPTATFALTSVTTVEGEETPQATGIMTIKGIENEVTFPAMFVMTDAGVRLTGVVTLDRTLWDIRYGSETFFENLGDNLIEDQFALTLDVVFASAE